MWKHAMVVSLVAGCASTDELSTSEHEVRGRPHDIRSQPLWTVEGAVPLETGTCFGAAVAVGDLDGDGYRDIVVAEPPCRQSATAPGRIAVYRGGRHLPATTPVVTELTWPGSKFGGGAMRLAIADVDDDGRDDLVVSARGGVQVFSKLRDLTAPLAGPSFRAPAATQINSVVAADVNGNGRGDR